MRVDSNGEPAASGGGHWDKFSRQWEHLGPPLRPTEDDLSVYAGAVREWTQGNGRPPRALVLGATPQLCHLPWPDGTDLLAVDKAPGMLENVWPGPPGTALCADWTTMDLPAASRDIVLGDGSMNCVALPDGHRRVMERLRDIVAPGGTVALRIYVPPARRESPPAVFEDLAAGRIDNLSQLKIRLWGALQETPEAGIRLGDVWGVLHAAFPDRDSLADSIGWPREHLATIDTYRDQDTRYWLFSLDTARDLFAGPGSGFAWQAVHTPAYPLGDRCPAIVLRRYG